MSHEQRYQFLSTTYPLSMLALYIVTLLGITAPDAISGIPAIPAFAGQFTFPIALLGWPMLYLLGKRLLKIWDRKSIAAGTPFTPEGNGPLLRPDLVGDVSGREVRFTTVSRNHSVVTDLDGEPEAGAIVGRPDETNLELAAHADRTDGDLTALTTDPDLADELLTGRPRAALEASEDCTAVFAGNVPAALEAWNHDDEIVTYENGDEQILGWEDDPMMEETVLKDRTRTDDGELRDPKTTAGRATVAHVTRRERVDSDALQAQAEAVVAVADAFETATAAPSPPNADAN